YTIGQRNGLGLSGGPWFVVGKEVESNVVYLAQGYEPEEVYKQEFKVGGVHWINDQLLDPFEFPSPLFVKIRQGVAMHACRGEKKRGGWKIHLQEKVHGVAP